MNSNTDSIRAPGGQPDARWDGLAALAEVVDGLAAQDLDGLSDVVRAERVLELRRLVDRLEGHWLKELAGVDARGAAGADQNQQAASTAAWLRTRLHLGAGTATRFVRTARALFRGPLTATATALADATISVAHAGVLAHGTHDLPDHVIVEAEPVLVEAAGRLDPPRLRRVLGHLQLVVDPDGAGRDRTRRQQRRGLWLAPTWDGMVAIDGLLEPEAGQTLTAALEPLARPADAQDTRSGGQRRADALTELARRSLEEGRLPQTGGVRPQLTVTVDLDSLLGRPGPLGGEVGWAGPLDPEACQRLACDSAVTRVLVTRHPNHGPSADQGPLVRDPSRHPSRDWDTGLGGGYGPRWPCSRRSWMGPPPSHWRSGGPPGSSSPPNGPPWPSATAAVSSPTASAPWPGAKPIICATGSTAAAPISPTWP
jgi:hypothetical protein